MKHSDRVARSFNGAIVPPGKYEGFRFERCEFNSCYVGEEGGPETVLREICLQDCVVRAAYVVGARLEDVVVDGLDVLGPRALLEDCTFVRVVLRRLSGTWIVTPGAFPARPPRDWESRYRDVEPFAIDASEVAGPLELRWIPPSKVVLHEGFQACVNVEAAMARITRLEGNMFARVIEGGARSSEEFVYVSGPREGHPGKRAASDIEQLRRLRVCM
jgi:hypothetical protein